MAVFLVFIYILDIFLWIASSICLRIYSIPKIQFYVHRTRIKSPVTDQKNKILAKDFGLILCRIAELKSKFYKVKSLRKYPEMTRV